MRVLCGDGDVGLVKSCVMDGRDRCSMEILRNGRLMRGRTIVLGL